MTYYKQGTRPSYPSKPAPDFTPGEPVVYLPLNPQQRNLVDLNDPALQRGIVVGQNKAYVHVQFPNEPDPTYCRAHNLKRIE